MKPEWHNSIETNFEIRSRDSALTIDEYKQLPKYPLYFVLDNLRSAFNVGSIFRMCDILRVSGLFLCGCTAAPPNAKLEKTSMGTINHVPWRYCTTTLEAVRMLKTQGATIWAVETTSRSVAYDSVRYPDPIALILGNEALGVSHDVINECDSVIEMPVYGFKNSMNVAAACAVVGYKALESFKGLAH